MIPRYQKIILWVLLVSSVLMAAYLIRMRARAQDQLAAAPEAAPMALPVAAPPVQATLMIANDADGSLSATEQALALPAEPTTRARALLNDLFANYARPGSSHPLAPIVAVNDVFLLPIPGSNNASPTSDPSPTGEMAVIDLNGAFADHHPSGILVETLTLLSILGTLHANMPHIAQVRFVVDGKPKDTLAGHADLTRTYLTANDVPATGEDEAAGESNASAPQKTAAQAQP